MLIEIIVDGQVINTVTMQELFELAAEGTIDPQTTVRINGKLGKAGQLPGLVFVSDAVHPSNIVQRPNTLVPTNQVTYGNDYNSSYPPSRTTAYPGNVDFLNVPNTPAVFHPPVYVQHPMPNPDSSGTGTAVTSLVMGILGLIAWIIPFFGLPITIIGLFCGFSGLSGNGRGMAIAGIILCFLGLILSVINTAIGFLLILATMDA